MLLSYGRHHIASSDMSLQLSDMSPLEGVDGSGHSHVADNGVVFQSSQSRVCVSLSTLWCLLGSVLVFAFVWGAIGLFWLTNKSACGEVMERVSPSVLSCPITSHRTHFIRFYSMCMLFSCLPMCVFCDLICSAVYCLYVRCRWPIASLCFSLLSVPAHCSCHVYSSSRTAFPFRWTPPVCTAPDCTVTTEGAWGGDSPPWSRPSGMSSGCRLAWGGGRGGRGAPGASTQKC
jgi:hypothetical protein